MSLAPVVAVDLAIVRAAVVAAGMAAVVAAVVPAAVVVAVAGPPGANLAGRSGLLAQMAAREIRAAIKF